MSETNLISLVEYAAMHDIDNNTARKRAARGAYKTAIKIGRNWLIDKNEPHVDHRITSGKYVGQKGKNNE